MGIVRTVWRTTWLTATLGTLYGVGYIQGATRITFPLPGDDPVFRSKLFSDRNAFNNASTNDVVTRRIPIEKIKPELLEKEGALVTEFCRGVWSGWGEPWPPFLALFFLTSLPHLHALRN